VIEDGDEAREFREHFRGNRLGALDWPPIAEYRVVQTVRIFNPSDTGVRTPDRIPASVN